MNKISKPPVISFLAIGDELSNGRVVDTNSAYFAGEVKNIGALPGRTAVVGDERKDIKSALEFLLAASDCVLVTGGIGPTEDDLTREVLADFVSVPLEFSKESWLELQNKLRTRGREPNEASKQQCFFPAVATRLPNSWGTADGFWLRTEDQKMLVSLPGVPKETRKMFPALVVDLLRAEFALAPALDVREIRLFGLPESEVSTQIRELKLPNWIRLSYRASFPEVVVRLEAPPEFSRDMNLQLSRVETAVGSDFITCREANQTFSISLGQRLREKGLTLALAESCSGGMAASEIVSASGASDYFLGSAVVYSNQAKTDVLGVSSETLGRFGAVSVETAQEMAKGVRNRFSSSIGASITGIAGPIAETDNKPQGIFCVALSSEEREFCEVRNYPSSERNRFRRFSAFSLLDLVRRYLEKKPLSTR